MKPTKANLPIPKMTAIMSNTENLKYGNLFTPAKNGVSHDTGPRKRPTATDQPPSFR